MLRRRFSRHQILFTIAMASLSLPQPARAGVFILQGFPCWCDQSVVLGAWNHFQVWYLPDNRGECELTKVAFRLEGVPNEPGMMRSLVANTPLPASGDAFGDGVIIELPEHRGVTRIASIRLFITAPLAPQQWSILAHREIPGTADPVAEFGGDIGTWSPQAGLPSWVGDSDPECACLALPTQLCPIAVEPGTWSIIKHTYQ